MFENWEKMVAENQKRLLKVDVAKNATAKNQKSTDLDGTKFDSFFVDDFWKPGDRDRTQSSGCVFKED